MRLVVLAALLGSTAGVGALVGAATITDQQPLFLLAGLLAFCAVYLLGLLLATHEISPPQAARPRGPVLRRHRCARCRLRVDVPAPARRFSPAACARRGPTVLSSLPAQGS